jgi:hypothetical protein
MLCHLCLHPNFTDGKVGTDPIADGAACTFSLCSLIREFNWLKSRAIQFG